MYSGCAGSASILPLVRLGEEVLAGLGYEPVGFSSSLAGALRG
jgi:hypothetical protein